MPVLNVRTRFYPIRLTANMQNSVELTIKVENTGKELLWSECDVIVPESLSLTPNRSLTKGRLRIGIMEPGKSGTGKCKVYGSAKTYPYTYMLRLTVYGYGKDGVIVTREDTKVGLRCESIS